MAYFTPPSATFKALILAAADLIELQSNPLHPVRSPTFLITFSITVSFSLRTTKHLTFLSENQINQYVVY
jgi:hypothetical protein